jgi:hypothetical protein
VAVSEVTVIVQPKRFFTALISACSLLLALSFLGVGTIEANASEAKRLSIPKDLLEQAPEEFRNQFLPRFPPQNQLTKAAGPYSIDDWKRAIDSTWGAGPADSVKAARFQLFWSTIDEKYACFQDLDVNWDSVGNQYSTEIDDSTVSRGRFAAMLDHATRGLKEGHTMARDSTVYYTQPAPGVPLMFVGGWGVNDHFGAGLTPLPDSSLLVYKAISNHPLGLVPGDIVLGYDGSPWKNLYPVLLEAELPLTGHWWGSSSSSYTHAWLMAAGLNWHLFDTIDVLKYATGDTLPLATNALVNQDMSLFATEQMNIPGVPMPDYSSGELVNWGLVEGTQIGYIYCLGWFYEGEDLEWFHAISILKASTTGLIIDLRTCYGGNPAWACPGLELLFDRTVDEIGIDMRADPDDHFAMKPSSIIPPDWFKLNGDPANSYDRPIAVLVGPGSISMGDLAALLLAHHPRAKLFGKPTSASFNSPDAHDARPDFFFRYARSETYLFSNPGHYLTHDEFPSAEDFPWVLFQEVWLTPDAVAEGRDDVVEAAVAWINSATDVENDTEDMLPTNFTLSQNYPNPFNPVTQIDYYIPKRNHVTILVYNLLGQKIKTLIDEAKPAGQYSITWDGNDTDGSEVATGIYFYYLRADDYVETRKMLLLK